MALYRSHEPSPTEALYLGAILKDPDFAAAHAQGRGPHLSAQELKDHARGSNFGKTIDDAVKPRAVMSAPWDERKSYPGSKAVRQQEHTVQTADISFSVGNYSDILADITFRDIKGLLEREDLGGVMEFMAVVSFDGRIISVEKTVGSGDPFLDACVRRKLNNAVFKHPPGGRSRVKIRFHLRELYVAN